MRWLVRRFAKAGDDAMLSARFVGEVGCRSAMPLHEGGLLKLMYHYK